VRHDSRVCCCLLRSALRAYRISDHAGLRTASSTLAAPPTVTKSG
jgi:hypothetical protein